MKKIISYIVLLALTAITADASAQLYANQYGRKFILADASSSFTQLKLMAPTTLSGSGYTLTFPTAAAVGSGYLLVGDASGNLSWVNPTSYGYLSGVSTGSTLTGNGTSGSPLNLAALTGDVTTSAGSLATTVVSVGTSTASNVHSAEVAANAATNTNTALAIVKRDGSGNFSAGTITASLSGNATTATTLQTARAINGVNFDGSAPITITAAAGTLTGTTLASGVTASSLTSVGTLANLTVTNPISGSVTGSSGSFTGSLVGDVGGTQGATVIGANKVTYAKLQAASALGKLLGSPTTTAIGEISLGLSLSLSSSTLDANIQHDASLSGSGSSASSLTLNLGHNNTWTVAQTISASTNQLILGNSPHITISAPAPGTSEVYTIPDVSGTATFVLTTATPQTSYIPKWNGTTGNLTNSGLSEASSQLTINNESVTNGGYSNSGTYAMSIANLGGGDAIQATASGGGGTGYAVNATGKVFITGATTLSSFNNVGIVHNAAGGLLSSSLIVNADVSSSAAIAYSKLSLSSSILNSDLAGSIAFTKLVGTDITAVGTITTGTWSGTTIVVNKGGSGLAILTAHAVQIGNGTSNVTQLAVGTSGQVLTSGGSSSDPTWSSPVKAQSTPANPAGVAFANGTEMMGLASSITPSGSGTILIVISGDMTNNTSSDGAKVQIRYGTGNDPGNGTAVAGTAVGGTVQMSNGSANAPATGIVTTPFSVNAIVSGLTVNTPYWIDVSLAAVTGGTASIADVSISAYELK